MAKTTKKIPEATNNIVKNCTFTMNTTLDKSSLEVVKDVSKALLNLSELFLKQGTLPTGSNVSSLSINTETHGKI